VLEANFVLKEAPGMESEEGGDAGNVRDEPGCVHRLIHAHFPLASGRRDE